MVPTFVLLSQFLGSLGNGVPRVKKIIIISKTSVCTKCYALCAKFYSDVKHSS